MRWTKLQVAVLLLHLGAFACGQVEQELGDGSTSSSNGDVPPDAPQGGSATGGSSGNGKAGTATDVYGNPAPGACFEDGSACPSGYGCMLPWQEDGQGPILPGVCVPTCGETSPGELGHACAPNAEGGLGVCRPFTVDPATGYGYRAICTKDCDPLAPTCGASYSCELTAAAAGTFAFACLPVTRHEPLLEGESCDGLPMGQCGPGLSCVSRGSFAKCSKYCDLRSPGACPSPQICVTPRDFPDGNVGICGSAD